MDSRFNNRATTFANPYQSTAVPGLKVAYGQAAMRPEPPKPSRFGYEEPEIQAERSLYARIWDAIIDLVTEEAEVDRPIGISQLSRKTFRASADVAEQTFVCSGRGTQDYRFNQLINREYKG